jgi:hypothetical protein
VQGLGEADLVKNFKRGWVNGVAAELAVEVFVHFEKRYGNSATREEQSEYRPSGPAANDTAAGGLDVTNLIGPGWRGGREG